LPNVRAALEWCQARREHTALAELVSSYGVVWFLTTRGAEALEWLRFAEARDTELGLDAQIAWRTAAGWCHVVMMDGAAAISVANDALDLAPAGHPAEAPLRCLRGWMLSWSDADGARRDFDQARSAPLDSEMWQTNADYLEGCMELRSGHFEDALELFGSASQSDTCIHPVYPLLGRVVCLHFLERPQAALEGLDHARRRAGDGSWYFLDLAVPFVDALLAAGTSDADEVGKHLRDLITRTHERYPHLMNAWGFAVQAAIVAASLAGEAQTAASLYEGARKHGLHRRWEGANIAGWIYGKRATAGLHAELESIARRRGASMSLSELTDLAERVAGSVTVRPGPPRRRPQ
jgi:hypothetical protein